MLEEEAGESIASMVARLGWEGFRAREKGLLARLAQVNGRVIATGGGIVLDPENVARMKATGLIVWLTAPPSVIRERMQADRRTEGQRPALGGRGATDEIEDVLAVREPLYTAAADIVIATDGLDVSGVCREILRELEIRNWRATPSDNCSA
jgi:shikimate kinase